VERQSKDLLRRPNKVRCRRLGSERERVLDDGCGTNANGRDELVVESSGAKNEWLKG